MKKNVLVSILLVFGIFGTALPISSLAADDPAEIVRLTALVRQLVAQVQSLQAQVQARIGYDRPLLPPLPSVLPASDSSMGILVEVVPVSDSDREQLNSISTNNSSVTLSVQQSQTAQPGISLLSQKSLESWRIGGDFTIRWQVSGFGNPALNMKNILVVLVDAQGVNVLGYLCRKCSTDNVTYSGNEGRLIGRVGAYWTEDKKLMKLLPGYYKVRVALADDPFISATSDGVLDVALSSSSNLAPSIVGVTGPDALKSSAPTSFKVEAYDPDGTELSYRLDPGDGVLGSAYILGVPSSDNLTGTFTYTYLVPGEYIQTFSVSDARGITTKASRKVVVK